MKHVLPGRNWVAAVFISVLGLVSGSAQTVSYTISTIAGNGTEGFAGDGGSGTSAEIANAFGLAADSSGNIYIADQFNNRIRKLTPGGVISTVAGNGTLGFAGDGGAATSAELSSPLGVAVDSSGNLYIADTGNSVIRMVSSGGTISTVAGSNSAGEGYAGDGGAATSAQLGAPSAIAIDSAGALYIADTANSVVRKIAGGTISTIAGNHTFGFGGDGGAATSAVLNAPEGVLVDAAGNVYIADTSNNRIRRVDTSGVITTFAGKAAGSFSGDGGLATAATLNNPKGIAFDAAGRMFIADYFNNRIRMITPDGIINTIAGSTGAGYSGDGGPATSALFFFPSGVAAAPGGLVYVADNQNNRIRLLTPVAAVPSIGGIVSASGYGGFSSIAPGSWIEIYGSNLAIDSRGLLGSDFSGVSAPTSLDGTSVTVGGQAAFPAYISPGQVNVLVPSGVTVGSQPVVIKTPGGTSGAFTINVNATEPGLLTPASFDIGGKQYVVAQFTDFTTYVLPPGAIPGLTSRQAHPGEVIVIFGIGFGGVTPSYPAGELVPGLNALAAPIQFAFNGTAATSQYAGLTPNQLGLFQFNLVVPSVPSSDAVPLTFTLGGAPGTQTLYTAVQ